MDPLTDMLSLLAVESAYPSRFEGAGAWSLRFEGHHHLKFGTVLAGAFWLARDDSERPIQIGPGDCYLLTGGCSYVTSSHPGLPTEDGHAVYARFADRQAAIGGGPPETVIVAGSFTFDETNAPLLLDLLPPVVHVAAAQPGAAALRALSQMLADEMAQGALGASIVADRLAHIVLVQALRAYAAGEADAKPRGWLAALSDQKIGRALRLMHQAPAHPWRVGELASAVGMSRSAFAQRFRHLLGSAPLDYLTRWRMHLARERLRTGMTVGTVAYGLGYTSESAFSTAFRRVIGRSPARYWTKQAAATANSPVVAAASL